MTNKELYDEAFIHMGQAPPEPDEPRGPGRPKGQHNKPGHTAGRPPLGKQAAVQMTTRLDPALLADVKAWAKRAGCTVNRAVNVLISIGLED